MSSQRLVRLDAIAAAKEVHRQLQLERRLSETAGQVDVFSAIEELGIPLFFRPLKAALGLYLSAPAVGIMITTERSRHIQRFTAAHELGHATLRHNGSIDIGTVSDDDDAGLSAAARRSERGVEPPSDDEVAADAFASEFMLPRWLYQYHIRSQAWTVKEDLTRPAIVYQLALRMGASFEATCRGLEGHNVLPHVAVQRLLTSRVAELKKKASEGLRPDDSWADAWELTERDNGHRVIGSPADLIRLDLSESPSAGFRWDVSGLASAGFELLINDIRSLEGEPAYGAAVRRTVVFRRRATAAQTMLDVDLRETQSWRPISDSDPRFEVHVALLGKEGPGWSRAVKIRKAVT